MTAQEIGLFISLVALGVSVFFNFKSSKRSDDKVVSDEATSTATMMVKLENISGGVEKIDKGLSELSAYQRADHDKLIITEASVKSAHKRLDSIGAMSNGIIP